MNDASSLRNISDTARWVATYRALESERPDAWFHDPLAKRLAGEHGERVSAGMEFANRNAWSFVARTVLFDRFILERVGQGAEIVVNLAAGLDTRPYRMTLPPTLQWIEVDLPEIVAEKREALAQQKPVCMLERVALDLADVSARRALFAELGRRSSSVLIVSEGLVVYLAPDDVAALARDLAAPQSFKWWILDMVSPRLLQMLQATIGRHLDQAGAPLKFAPIEGPAFFAQCGWKPVDVTSLLHAAARLKRLPFFLRLMAFLPDPAGRKPNRPWGGVCVFARTE